MSLLTRLAFPPLPDESARGLVLRLAEDNLCSSSQMCDWLELPRIDTDFTDPTRASEIMGIAPEAFAAMGFIAGGTEAFLGHRMPLDTSTRQSMRVCPACLAEAPYHRRVWEHRQVDACPVHCLKLLDRCAECVDGPRFGWKRHSLMLCNHGHDLSRQTVPSTGDCIGAKVVYRHLGLRCEGPDLPPDFSGFCLSDLLDMLFFLGRTDLVIAQANPERVASRQMSTDGAILDAGARIALGWPGSFDPFAERVRAAYSGRATVAKQYDYLHRFIMKCGSEPYAGMLREAYASHLSKRDDITETSWPDFLPRKPTVQPGITTLEVLAILGIGRQRFLELKALPSWTDTVPHLPARGGVPVYRRADVLAYKERTRLPGTQGTGVIAATVADRMLGMGMATGKSTQLGKNGFFSIDQGAPSNGRRRPTVNLAELEAFIDKIRELAVEKRPTTPIRFEIVLRKTLARRVVTLTDLVRCLLSGELRGHIAEPGKPGLASMAFDDTGVTDLLDRLSSPSRTGRMNLGAVEEFLGLPTVGVRHLVRERLLPEPTKYGGVFFDARAVERFRDLHVYRTELGAQAGGGQSGNEGQIPSGMPSPVTSIPIGLFMRTALFRKSDL